MSLLNLAWNIAQDRQRLLFGTVLSALAIVLSTIIYRLCFHPLAHIPGPRLAAITDLWTYYYEIKGTLPSKMRELRQRNQWPAVMRIGPNRVAIHDAKQYDVIYRVGSKFIKDPSFYLHFPHPDQGATTLTATDKTWHATRRKISMKALSRQNVGSQYPLITEKLNKVLGKMEQRARKNASVDVCAAWRSMTLDIITDFALGSCIDTLEDPNLEHGMLLTMDRMMSPFYLFNRLPIVKSVMGNPIISPLLPKLKDLEEYINFTMSSVDNYKPDKNRRYLFDSMMDKDVTPPISRRQLQMEAQDLVIAGSDTTATTLINASIYLARRPDLWEKLYEEVKPVFDEADGIPQLNALEPLPLLTACIKESLRITTAAPAYLWRVVPDTGYPLDIAGKTVRLPPGTTVGMSAWVQHNDETLFPNPEVFDPNRWLESEELDRYLVAFSKGTRQCGGITLAWMELYLSLACMVKRFVVKGEKEPGKKLVLRDCFVAMLDEGSKFEVVYGLRDA